jgi:membrane protein YdbS with pleckstrin-like domain
MKCSQCRQEVPAGSSFCPHCGTALDVAGPTSASDRPAGAQRLQAGGAPSTVRDAPEQEVWSGSYSPKAMTGPFIGAGLLILISFIAASIIGPLGLIGAGLGALLVAYLGLVLLYRQMTVQYRLTSQRLLRTSGILSRTDDRILVVEIDDVTVQQGLFERMFNVGTIVLDTRDDTTPVMRMGGIKNPRQVADFIDEARRAERTRRGLYTINA